MLVWVVMICFFGILFLLMILVYLVVVFNFFDLVIKDLDKELFVIRLEVLGFLGKELGINVVDVNRDENFLDLILFFLGNIELFFL